MKVTKYASLILCLFLIACASTSQYGSKRAASANGVKFATTGAGPASILQMDDMDTTGCTENSTAKAPASLSVEGNGPKFKEELVGTGPIGERYDFERYQRMLDTALELCKSAQELWEQGKLNEALNALDDAYSLVLRVDPDSRPELIQQKEDLRFLIAKRIMEIHAARFTVANGLHTEIPLVINAEVMEEIKRFQGPERNFFISAYRRSGRYRPMIVRALKENGLPEELSWLPLIESGFKVRAFSRARALGLWQFIASTGYKYGLNRNTWIDERLDPEKSTRAAIAYLIELHKIFGDWMTVLAAYNCGEGTVLRVIRRQKINYLDHFWDLYQMLPRETARYVPRFIATLLIIKEPEKYGFNDLGEPDPPLQFEKVELDKQVHLQEVARVIGCKKEELMELNPELRYKITPPGNYALRVPMGKKQILLARLNEIEPWRLPKKKYVYHIVRRGETLSSIALRYGSRVRDIVLANRLRHRHLIRVGQKLKIPLRTRTLGQRFKRPKSRVKGRKYVVKKGDSLWAIARKFRTDVSTLKRINGLASNCLSVGEVLRIPD